MRICTLIVFLLLYNSLFAQDGSEIMTPSGDDYGVMRTLADSGNIAAAKSIGLRLLKENPENYDVAILLANIYGWESAYDSAFLFLNAVLQSMPGYPDAHYTRCALYYWMNDWQQLLAASSEALLLFPENADLMYKQALALFMLERGDESEEKVDELLLLYPENEPGNLLKAEMNQAEENEESVEFFIGYMYDHFREPYLRNWHMVSTGANYPVKRGSITPALNVGHFVDPTTGFIESTAFQLNTDAYFTVTEKNYLLVGYGISTAKFFPRHRAVFNIWQELPAAWTVSAGLRYFYFDQHYLFYSAGIEKYAGNYWFNLNNYIFRKEYGLSVASYLTVRRYLESKYSYLSVTLGYGTSPDEPLTDLLDLQRLKAVSIRMEVVRKVTDKIRISAGVGYQYEEYREQLFRNRYTFQTVFYYKPLW